MDRIQVPAVFGLENNYKAVPEPDFEYKTFSCYS